MVLPQHVHPASVYRLSPVESCTKAASTAVHWSRGPHAALPCSVARVRNAAVHARCLCCIVTLSLTASVQVTLLLTAGDMRPRCRNACAVSVLHCYAVADGRCASHAVADSRR